MKKTTINNVLKGKVQKLQEELDSLLTTGNADTEKVMELSRKLDKLIIQFYSEGTFGKVFIG